MTRRFTQADARASLRALRVRAPVSTLELARGMNIELEHRGVTRGNRDLSARIALDHLRERPDYYRLLAWMEGAPRLEIHDNPRPVRTLAGQLDLLGVISTQVAQQTQRIETRPPSPPSPLASEPAHRPISVRSESPVEARKPLTSIAGAQPIAPSVESTAADRYIERLLDRSKKAFAVRVIAWIRDGELSDAPDFSDIRGMTEAKALDVRRRLESLLKPSRAHSLNRAAKPATVPRGPASQTGKSSRELPALVSPPIDPAPEAILALEADKQTSSYWIGSLFPEIVDAHLRGKDRFRKLRLSDARVSRLRERALQDCANARAYVATLKLTPELQQIVDSRLRSCERLRIEPFPWSFQRGETADRMTRAWAHGKLYFNPRDAMWHAGSVSGADAARVFAAATQRQPYSLETEAEIEQELESHDRNHDLSLALNEKNQDAFRAAHRKRIESLVRLRNKVSPIGAKVSFAALPSRWANRESDISVRLTRIATSPEWEMLDILASKAKKKALARLGLSAAEIDEAYAALYSARERPSRSVGEQSTTVLRARWESGLRVAQNETSNKPSPRPPHGSFRFDKHADEYAVRILAESMAHELRDAGYSVDVSDDSPVAESPSFAPARPSANNLMLKNDPKDSTLAVVSAEGLSVYAKTLEQAKQARVVIEKHWGDDSSVKIGPAVKDDHAKAYRVDATIHDARRYRSIPFPNREYTPDFFASSNGKRWINENIDSRFDALNLDPTKSASNPYLRDVWVQSARNIIRQELPNLIAQYAKIEGHTRRPKAELVALLKRAQLTAQAWSGLRAGSLNASRVGEAIDKGRLFDKVVGGTGFWVYKTPDGRETRGKTAWEAFKQAEPKD